MKATVITRITCILISAIIHVQNRDQESLIIHAWRAKTTSSTIQRQSNVLKCARLKRQPRARIGTARSASTWTERSRTGKTVSANRAPKNMGDFSGQGQNALLNVRATCPSGTRITFVWHVRVPKHTFIWKEMSVSQNAQMSRQQPMKITCVSPVWKKIRGIRSGCLQQIKERVSACTVFRFTKATVIDRIIRTSTSVICLVQSKPQGL